jgi:hypothetical protein
MLRTIDSVTSLSATSHERFSPGAWPPLTVLRAMCEALHEGLAVHRQYETLRSKGVPHDAALRRAAAIGSPSLAAGARQAQRLQQKACAVRATA